MLLLPLRRCAAVARNSTASVDEAVADTPAQVSVASHDSKTTDNRNVLRSTEEAKHGEGWKKFKLQMSGRISSDTQPQNAPTKYGFMSFIKSVGFNLGMGQ